jgi:crotonobetainyl-CoA:carnitine CoA-transferase CaiB-like acyl-CoA transferase
MRALAEGCASMTRDQLCAACDAFGVPAGPLKTLDEVMTDPHLLARGVFNSFDHPQTGVFPAIRLPYRFQGFDDPVTARPPLLGEHNDQVLTQLGYSPAQIEGLRARGTL